MQIVEAIHVFNGLCSAAQTNWMADAHTQTSSKSCSLYAQLAQSAF